MHASHFDALSQPVMPLSISDYDFRATTSDSLLDLSALTLDSAPSTPLPDFSTLTLDSTTPQPEWIEEAHVHMLWDTLKLDHKLVQQHIDSSCGQLHVNFCWRWNTRPCETQLTPLTYLVDQGPRNRNRNIHDIVRMVRWLIINGADPQVRDARGYNMRETLERQVGLHDCLHSTHTIPPHDLIRPHESQEHAVQLMHELAAQGLL